MYKLSCGNCGFHEDGVVASENGVIAIHQNLSLLQNYNSEGVANRSLRMMKVIEML